MTATLNGARAVSVTLTTLWRGAWWAEVDLDPTDATVAPSGAATLAMLGGTLIGTVDPRLSGRFLASNRIRVVAGAGGWDKPVPRQDYHNPNGVLSAQVYQAAASIVGETVLDPSPINVGVSFERAGGAAAAVFGDRDWYVDAAGMTHVDEWPAVAADASVEILEYYPDRQELVVSSDTLILPGTTFTDPRFDGTLVARDVEQIVGPSGSRARIWCSAAGVTRAMSAFTNMVRAVVGRQWLRSYRCRVISQDAGGTLTLQAVNAPLGTPDMRAKPMWVGCQGDSATVRLSSECDVRFQEGDPSRPIVTSWAPGALPLKRVVDASAEVDIGPTASAVALAGGASPLVLAPPYESMLGDVTTFATALATAATALAAAMTVLSSPAGSAAATAMATAATALATAIGALPPPATVKVTAA